MSRHKLTFLDDGQKRRTFTVNLVPGISSSSSGGGSGGGGVNTLYSANDIIGAGRVATITDSLLFTSGSGDFTIGTNIIIGTGATNYNFPWTRGIDGDVLISDGVGNLTFQAPLQQGDLYRDNILLEGGVVCEPTGLDCYAWASEYVIANVYYDTLVTSTFTLSPPDITNPRIDLIIIDNVGAISVIEGVPAANPFKPDLDEETQLELGFAIVGISGNITNLNEDLIFDENVGPVVEWTVSTSPTGGDPVSVTEVFHGVTSYFIPQNVTTDILAFSVATPVVKTIADILVFAFRTTTAWADNDRLRVKLINSVTGQDSNYVVIRPTNDQQFGLDMTLIDTWQNVTIPLGRFNNADVEYDGLQFKFDNTTPATDVYLDYIRIQGGVFNPNPTVDGNGIYGASATLTEDHTTSGGSSFSYTMKDITAISLTALVAASIQNTSGAYLSLGVGSLTNLGATGGTVTLLGDQIRTTTPFVNLTSTVSVRTNADEYVEIYANPSSFPALGIGDIRIAGSDTLIVDFDTLIDIDSGGAMTINSATTMLIVGQGQVAFGSDTSTAALTGDAGASVSSASGDVTIHSPTGVVNITPASGLQVDGVTGISGTFATLSSVTVTKGIITSWTV